MAGLPEPSQGCASTSDKTSGLTEPSVDTVGHTTCTDLLSSREIFLNIDHVNFQGGSSRQCIAEWRKITADKWVLDQVQGVWPNFLIKPIQFSYPKRFDWSEAEHEIIDNELTILLRKGVIKRLALLQTSLYPMYS